MSFFDTFIFIFSPIFFSSRFDGIGQLFTIMVKLDDGTMISLASYLMTRCTTAAYIAVFNHIKQLMYPHMKVVLVMSDFEAATRAAEVFNLDEDRQILGCHFHLCQILEKKKAREFKIVERDENRKFLFNICFLVNIRQLNPLLDRVYLAMQLPLLPPGMSCFQHCLQVLKSPHPTKIPISILRLKKNVFILRNNLHQKKKYFSAWTLGPHK